MYFEGKKYNTLIPMTNNFTTFTARLLAEISSMDTTPSGIIQLVVNRSELDFAGLHYLATTFLSDRLNDV
jgi:hypothetical protein